MAQRARIAQKAQKGPEWARGDQRGLKKVEGWPRMYHKPQNRSSVEDYHYRKVLKSIFWAPCIINFTQALLVMLMTNITYIDLKNQKID